MSQAPHDPLRMYLVVRRGAFGDLSTAGEMTGAAAVRCVREFAGDPELEAWRPRPGKVVLRARGGQWAELLREEERMALVGDAVAALPPRRRSGRSALLERMQAMTSALEPPPQAAEPDPAKLTYLVNPRVEMSSGKTRESPMFYLPHGDGYAVVASNAASKRAPAWWLNLQASPDAEVAAGEGWRAVRAREATPEECDELWPRFVEMYRGYDHYKEIATREMPVVVLEPRP